MPIFPVLIPRIFYLLVSPSFLRAASTFLKICNELYTEIISVTSYMIMDVFRCKVCLSACGGLYATASV